MKKFGAIVWVIGSIILGSQSLFAGSDIEARSQRRFNIDFTPDRGTLLQGKIEYFFELLNDKTRVPLAGTKTEASNAALDQLLVLDANRSLDAATARGESLYVLMGKAAYLVKKDVSFFKTSALELDYWQATRKDLNVENNPAFHASSTSREFLSHGGGKIPESTLTLNGFSGAELSTNPAMKALMEMDPGVDAVLGKPAIVLSEHYSQFGRKLMARTSLESRSFSKYYAYEKGTTLVITYTLGYLYNILPNWLGGVEKMRVEALKGALEIIPKVESYRP